MMDDLDRLIAAVEAGEVGWNRLATIAEEAMLPREAALSATAYSGSLDAALRLHEALLPGWVVHDFTQYPLYWHIVLNGNTAPHFFHGKDPSPARAWLLAVLRAVKAQQSPPA